MNIYAYLLVIYFISVLSALFLCLSCSLNTFGYSLAILSFISIFAFLYKRSKLKFPALSFRIIKSYRYKKLIYWGWFSIAALAFLGGVINPPSNYDGITYRLPRVLYWLQNEGWYWIGSVNDRMDYSAWAQEWQFAPFFALGLGDRLLFLLNFIPYLLLPTLVFKALLLFKCKFRWAWYAMWTFPLFSGFLMQAASIGNDFIGAWLAVAAIAILHTTKPNNYSRFVYSALAVGLLSGMKASNLPLYLPLGFIWLWQLYLAKPDISKILKVSSVSLLLALCVSFAPTAVLNYKHTCDPFGAPQNNLKVTSKAQGIVGNVFLVAVGCSELPLNPFSKKINETVSQHLEKNGFSSWVRQGFPRFSSSISSEIPSEEGSGTGLLFSILFTASLLLPLIKCEVRIEHPIKK